MGSGPEAAAAPIRTRARRRDPRAEICRLGTRLETSAAGRGAAPEGPPPKSSRWRPPRNHDAGALTGP